MVGLVVVLALLGALAALALSSSRGDGLLSDLVAPSGTTGDPLSVGSPAAAGSGPAALVDASEVVACRADVVSLEAAMATARTVLGAVPLTLPELVKGGFLSDLPARPGFTFVPEVAAGVATGRVLVNGRTGSEGCAAPVP